MSILWLGAQNAPLRKENTFTFTSVRYTNDTLYLSYQIPFDGVVEMRVVQNDSTLYFAQWPSAQGNRKQKFYVKKLPAGSVIHIRYKGKLYTASLK
ncbi:MAG: hypothetical protein ACUVRD_07515 [Bacteroidia bacterium]